MSNVYLIDGTPLPTILWHYTTGKELKKLLEQRSILPSKNEPENEKEVPSIMFSSDPVWEESRYQVGELPDGKVILLNKKLLNQFGGGLYRISVKPEVAPLDWNDLKEQSGMSREAIQAIYDFAVEVGARTKNWFATFSEVPESDWIDIETMVEDQWISLNDERLVEVSAV